MPDQSSSADPAKKYWWVIGIVVPITVALIALFGGWHKPDPVIPTTPPTSSPASSTLNLGGTMWNGTLTGTSSEFLQIVFKADGTAVAQKDVTLANGDRVLDHCNWMQSDAKIKLDCPYETSGQWPNGGYTTFSLESHYRLSPVGQSLKGTRYEPNNPKQLVVDITISHE